jgi:hypothetical protein
MVLSVNHRTRESDMTYANDFAASRQIIAKATALAKAGQLDAAWALAQTDILLIADATKDQWLKWALR